MASCDFTFTFTVEAVLLMSGLVISLDLACYDIYIVSALLWICIYLFSALHMYLYATSKSEPIPGWLNLAFSYSSEGLR